MKPARAYLVVELPDGFPDPLRHTQAFEEGVELLLYTVGMIATAKGKAPETLNLAASYRSEGDPIYAALINEPRPGAMQ